MQSGSKSTRRNSGTGLISSAAMLAGAIYSVMGASQNANATVVFNDTFANGSTVDAVNYNTAATPTSNSTNYNVATNKTGSASIATGALEFGNSATSSGIAEVQAVFATGANVVTLTPGQQIDLIVTFTDTGGVLTTGSNASGQLDFGLYNSSNGGLSPYNNLLTTGLTSTGTGDATGGVQSWVGYSAQTYFTGASGAEIIARPGPQTSTTNTNQEVLLPGTSGSSSSNSPGAIQVGGTTAAGAVTLTAGNVYTDDLNIVLNSAGVETITNSLYNGAGTGGTLVYATGAESTTVNAGSYLTPTFDSLAVGYRETSDAATEALTLNQVEVTVTSVPEPATLSLLALSGVPLLGRRRKAMD